MNRIVKLLLTGTVLAAPLFATGCVYDTYDRYPQYRHYTHYSSYYDDDDYRARSYNYRVGAVWIPGHWYRGVWISGHWE
jgi:hypothetical protein